MEQAVTDFDTRVKFAVYRYGAGGRSAERLCARRWSTPHRQHGPAVGLATEWYSSRLAPNARRPGPAQMRELLARLGFIESVWDPQADTVGASGVE